MSTEEPNADEGRQQRRFVADVRQRSDLHKQEKREGDASFWSSVGMMGTIGWSIALPVAGGVLFGRWLDSRLEAGHVFMVFFMLVGLGVGAFVVWRLIREKL